VFHRHTAGLWYVHFIEHGQHIQPNFVGRIKVVDRTLPYKYFTSGSGPDRRPIPTVTEDLKLKYVTPTRMEDYGVALVYALDERATLVETRETSCTNI
jgi:hypothetical protein